MLTVPSSKRGRMTLSMVHSTAMLEATVHSAKTAAPSMASTNSRGCSATIDVINRVLRRSRVDRRGVGSSVTGRFYQRHAPVAS